MGWLIALAVVIALALLPVGVRVCYDVDGPFLWLTLGPARWTLYPGRKKKKKKQKTPPGQPHPAEKQEKPGGSITDFVPLVQLALDLLGDLRRKLRVKLLDVKITLAGGDPCDLGISYGRTQAAVANLDPHLERLFVIKKKKIRVECDFTGDKTLVLANVALTITLGRLITLAVRYGCRGIGEYLKIMKSRKGGAVK